MSALSSELVSSAVCSESLSSFTSSYSSLSSSKSPRVVGKLRRELTGIGRNCLVTETETNRSISVSLTIYDRLISTTEMESLFNRKLLADFPRFRSRVVDDGAFFEEIPGFEASECITETVIGQTDASGSDEKTESSSALAEIQSVMAVYMSALANRSFAMADSRPLWRAHFYHFAKSKRSAMVFRIHHCIADGFTIGVIVSHLSDNYCAETGTFESWNHASKADASALSLSSASRESSLSQVRPNYGGTTLPPLPSTLKTHDESGVADSGTAVVNLSQTAFAMPPKSGGLIVAMTKRVANKVTAFCKSCLYWFWFFIGLLLVAFKLARFTLSSEPLTALKPSALSENKKVAMSIGKAAVRKVTHRRKELCAELKVARVTFNDFMMAVVAETISKYFQKMEYKTPKFIGMGIPVDLRESKKLHSKYMGNMIGTYSLKCPIGSDLTFGQRLLALKKEMDFVKKTPEALVAHYMAKGTALLLPPAIAKPIVRYMTAKQSVVFSNVKGPPVGLYFTGARANAIVGVVPPPMGVSLGFIVMSYDGVINASVNMDYNVGGEDGAQNLIECFEQVLESQHCL